MPRYHYTIDRTFFLLLARSGIGEAEKHLNQLCANGARLHSQGQNFLIIEHESPPDESTPSVLASSNKPVEPERTPQMLLEEVNPPPEMNPRPNT